MCDILIINSLSLPSLSYCFMLYHSITVISQKPHITSDDIVQPTIAIILFHNFSQLCILQYFFIITFEQCAPHFSLFMPLINSIKEELLTEYRVLSLQTICIYFALVNRNLVFSSARNLNMKMRFHRCKYFKK